MAQSIADFFVEYFKIWISERDKENIRKEIVTVGNGSTLEFEGFSKKSEKYYLLYYSAAHSTLDIETLIAKIWKLPKTFGSNPKIESFYLYANAAMPIDESKLSDIIGKETAIVQKLSNKFFKAYVEHEKEKECMEFLLEHSLFKKKSLQPLTRFMKLDKKKALYEVRYVD